MLKLTIRDNLVDVSCQLLVLLFLLELGAFLRFTVHSLVTFSVLILCLLNAQIILILLKILRLLLEVRLQKLNLSQNSIFEYSANRNGVWVH